MKAPIARYAAWCCRQGTSAQCNPVVVGFIAVVITVWVIASWTTHEVSVHKTGLMQIAYGAGAALAVLAAAGLAALAMRIVNATPAPVIPLIDEAPAVRESATILAMTLTPEDRADMEAEADRLASGEVDFTVTERGSLFELREPEEAS